MARGPGNTPASGVSRPAEVLQFALAAWSYGAGAGFAMAWGEPPQKPLDIKNANDDSAWAHLVSGFHPRASEKEGSARRSRASQAGLALKEGTLRRQGRGVKHRVLWAFPRMGDP